MGTVTAPWKQLLLQALESNSHLRHSSYFQLATIGLNGRPSNRTVVFRGFVESSEKIQINTDTRSRKIEELKHCPFAEICCYFTDSWEQFRINGSIDIIDGSNPDPVKLQNRFRLITIGETSVRTQLYSSRRGLKKQPIFLYRLQKLQENVSHGLIKGEIREKSWFSGSVRSRTQYLGPHPGLPRLNEKEPLQISLDPSAGPVSAFCLLVFDPDQVDYLNLKNNQRLMFTSRISDDGEKCWTSETVNL